MGTGWKNTTLDLANCFRVASRYGWVKAYSADWYQPICMGLSKCKGPFHKADPGKDMKPEFNERADELIADGRWAESRTMLETAIREMPADWKPCSDDEQALTIAFWDQGEFLATRGCSFGANSTYSLLAYSGQASLLNFIIT